MQSNWRQRYNQRSKSREYAETHPGMPIPGTAHRSYHRPKGRMPYSRARKGGGFSDGRHDRHTDPEARLRS